MRELRDQVSGLLLAKAVEQMRNGPAQHYGHPASARTQLSYRNYSEVNCTEHNIKLREDALAVTAFLRREANTSAMPRAFVKRRRKVDSPHEIQRVERGCD